MVQSVFLQNLITSLKPKVVAVETAISTEFTKLETEVKGLVPQVEKDVEDEVTASKTVIENEVASLKTALAAKLAAIEKNNKVIATVTTEVAALEAEVVKIGTFIEKLVTVSAPPAKPVITPTPVVTTTPTV